MRPKRGAYVAATAQSRGSWKAGVVLRPVTKVLFPGESPDCNGDDVVGDCCTSPHVEDRAERSPADPAGGTCEICPAGTPAAKVLGPAQATSARDLRVSPSLQLVPGSFSASPLGSRKQGRTAKLLPVCHPSTEVSRGRGAESGGQG